MTGGAIGIFGGGTGGGGAFAFLLAPMAAATVAPIRGPIA